MFATFASLTSVCALADSTPADGNGGVHSSAQSIIYQSDWSQRDVSLRVVVTDGIINGKDVQRQSELPNRTLTIEKLGDDGSRNKIFSYDTMDNFLTAYVTGEEGSNLYTSWVTGSAYRFIVYSFESGKVVPVLDVGSRAIPEVVLQGNGDRAVVVSNIDWIKGKDGTSKLGFISADIYKWDGHVYKLYKRSVPWPQRLKVIKEGLHNSPN